MQAINNEYRDPLGGEADFSTDVLAAFAQVTYRIKGDWFLGIQGIVSDVQYRPDTPQDADYLDRVGAEDTTSGGIGPVVSYDSRDNIHYPRSGTLAELQRVLQAVILGQRGGLCRRRYGHQPLHPADG
jgi:outer membrane protein assembly factor BamA